MKSWLDSVRPLVREETWSEASLRTQKGGDPADFLLKGAHLTPAQVLESLSAHYDLPAMLLGQYEPQEEALSLVGEDLARRLTVLPLFVLRGHLYVAVARGGDLHIEDLLSQITDLGIEQVVSTTDNIEQALNRCYLAGERSARKMESLTFRTSAAQSFSPAGPKGQGMSPPRFAGLSSVPASPMPGTVASSGADDAPSVKVVNHILASAIRLGASDIHLEPFEDSVMLRYRLDGVLREYPAPPLDMIKAVTSRIKIVSDLDVSERRMPQDGRASYEVDGRSWDLRVSLIPNLYGESVVIRILDSGSDRKSLRDMGFSPPMLERFERLVKRPHGMILVTGPTGSGKSTTLYATLRHVLTPEKKIITLEDPVEAQIKGVTQFQMNSSIGFTFARALRSVLRHDPEIVLVGEIRDGETAEIAIRAALTGHLLFSTLHTNDAASAATRLMDMGVQGYMVLTSLVGVLAQRLVRRLCPQCKAPLDVTRGHLEALGLPALPEGATPYRPVGCTRCEQVGYKGRMAIYELLEVTPAMRRLAPNEMSADRLRILAGQETPFVDLRESCLEKWYQGNTSLEDVVKVTLEG